MRFILLAWHGQNRLRAIGEAMSKPAGSNHCKPGPIATDVEEFDCLALLFGVAAGLAGSYRWRAAVPAGQQ